MSSAAKVALLTFYAGFLGFFVGVYFAVGAKSTESNVLLKVGILGAVAVMMIGTALCWRCGWRRFKEESSAKGVGAFFAYVWFAPISLPFSIE